MRLNSDCTAYSLLWIARTPYIQHVPIFIWNRLCMCVCVLPRIEIESRYRSQFQSSFIRLYLYRSVSISFSFDAKQAALLPINNFLLVWIPNQMNLFRNIKKFLLIHSPACSLAHRLFHFRFSVVCEDFFFEKWTFAFLIRIYVLFVLPSLSNFNAIKMSLKKEEFEENPHLIMQNPISTAYTLSHVYIFEMVEHVEC